VVVAVVVPPELVGLLQEPQALRVRAIVVVTLLCLARAVVVEVQAQQAPPLVVVHPAQAAVV
jgi:hypothetical protein